MLYEVITLRPDYQPELCFYLCKFILTLYPVKSKLYSSTFMQVLIGQACSGSWAMVRNNFVQHTLYEVIRDITAPISHIPVIAVGGVEIDTVSDYINAGAIGVGLGSNLVDKTLIKENRFDELATLAESFVKKTCL